MVTYFFCKYYTKYYIHVTKGKNIQLTFYFEITCHVKTKLTWITISPNVYPYMKNVLNIKVTQYKIVSLNMREIRFKEAFFTGKDHTC